ncbi:MAG: hypothetical protein QF752_05340, partial [Planctomycetota bacterium]|nr:hypothetical protein [Planctomycetota bacterium]
PTLDRDLETICLKCLDKEPQRRYRSAGELADDLERWLAGRPIQARPLGAGERIQKWVRRRPAVAGLLLALTVSVAVGLVGILTQWRRAEQNAHDAQKQARDLTIRAKHMARNVYQNHMRRLHESFQKNNLIQLYNRMEEYEQTQDPFAPTPGFEWHLLKRLVAPRNRTFDLLIKPKGDARPPLRRIALDPQGTTLAVAADGRVVLWNLTKGEPITDHILPSWEKTERVCQVAWTPDGGGLSVTSFLPPKKGSILRLEPNGFEGNYQFQPDRLWQSLRVRRLPARGSQFDSPEPFDPDLFAGALYLHNREELKSLYNSLGSPRTPWLPFVPSFLFTIPSRSEWVVGGAILREPDLPEFQKSSQRTQGSLFLWNPETRNVLKIRTFQKDFIHHGVIDPSGKRIATPAPGGIHVHSLSTLENAYHISLAGQDEPHRIAFRPDGIHLAACFRNGLVTLTETQEGGNTYQLIDPSAPGSDLLFLPGKRELVTAHKNGILRIWNTGNRRVTRILASRSSDSIEEIAFDPHTNRIVQILQSGGISSRRVAPRTTWEASEFPSSHWHIPCGLSSTGRYAYGNLANRGLQVIELASGKTHQWEDPKFRAQTVRFPDSGNGFGILAYHTAEGQSHTRIVWKPFRSEPPRSLGSWPGLLSDRLFRKKPGGSSFIVGIQDETDLHWDMLELDPDRTEDPPILAHGSGILIQMALSTDGERVATVTCDESGARWKLQVRELGRGTTIWERDLGRVPCTELLYHRAADRDRLFLVRLGEQEENIPSSVQILDGRDGEELLRLHASVEGIGQIHLDPSGRHLFAHTRQIDLSSAHPRGGPKIQNQIELWDGRPLSPEE